MQLKLANLSLSLLANGVEERILRDVSFFLEEGGRLGIVGESGSGKSMTALSILGLVPEQSRLEGRIDWRGENIVNLSEDGYRSIRGNRIAMIFQEPMTALNPVKTIGAQVAEAVALHKGQSKTEALRSAEHWLERVGLPSKSFSLKLYPHQLSGGQRQRVLIAAALAGGPELLIADEPTTALDTTIQRQILRLIDRLVAEEQLSLIIISHDLGVIAAMADDVIVMREGRVVEAAPAVSLFKSPRDSYTIKLMAACPDIEKIFEAPATANRTIEKTALLRVEDLQCSYRLPRRSLFESPGYNEAVRNVSFSVQNGESLGIVGESGSGKSTLAKAIAGLVIPRSGQIEFNGQRIDQLSVKERHRAALPISMIFQDPYGSLNPRHTIERAILEPLHKSGLSPKSRLSAAIRALRSVQLDETALARYPHQFSGGQRQRIAIARALINEPKMVIADEPVAALDVSIQAQIIDLLNELRSRLDLTILFISHDLAVVREICDRTIVMCDGEIVDSGPTAKLFQHPEHDYTRMLLAAVLPADPAVARAKLS